MARGKRYLVDLLSSKVIVRVQAEGFNGYGWIWLGLNVVCSPSVDRSLSHAV
jgi:hypothetical protein